jgi:magnesium chelatase subunit D
VREGREGNLVVFLVDASGSMSARARLREVKTAVLSLLVDAYQRRDKVALITFRGTGATVALPPTTSIEVAALRLRELHAGGRTPLAEGLMAAAQVLRVQAIKDAARRPLLVVVTDGRATAGPGALARSQQAAAHLARCGVGGAGISSVVLDCEPRGAGAVRLGLARQLAAALGADYLDIGEVAAASLTATVRARTRPAAGRVA